MKNVAVLFLVSASCALTAHARAEPVAKGVYKFSTEFYENPLDCLVTLGEPFSNGYIINPGPGQTGTEVGINATDVYGDYADNYYLNHFPPQPAGGLKNWTTSALLTQFDVRSLTETKLGYVQVKISVQPVSIGSAVANFSITSPGCVATFPNMVIETTAISP